MPLAPPAIALTLGTNLLATGHLGLAMPKFAGATALGVSLWATKATVSVTGAGAAGTGIATLPLLVPQPLLLVNLQTSFLTFGVTGFFSPLTALGLANGLSLSLVQGIIFATVVGVGSGAGVAKVVSPPAYLAFQEAYASFGMVGPGAIKMALALGATFDKTFAAFSIPIPIVGPAGPAPGVGTGTGKII